MDELVDTHDLGADVEVAVDASGVTVVKLSGEIDIANVGPVRAAIEPVVAEGPQRVVFDLDRLRFMDSTGLTMLLAVAARVAEVELRSPSALIRKVIEITGVSGVFVITP